MVNKREAERKKLAKQKAMEKRRGYKSTKSDEESVDSKAELEKQINEASAIEKPEILQHATITGHRTSQYLAKDIKIEQFSMIIEGKEYIKDTTLELNMGRRYGMIGLNGSGKSTILQALAARLVDIPDYVDIWLLHEEYPPSEQTALEAVISYVATEQKRLEALMMDIMENHPENIDLVEQIGFRLDELDPQTFEIRARELLTGLGFKEDMIQKKTKDMSGGWRMRVALAQALFVKPTLLLLDEPTNHLDLEACIWLENYLSKYEKILVMVSHSQDFLNGVCTNIWHLTCQGTFEYYSGNYDTFVRTRAENEANQMVKWKKEQDDIKHLKQFIATSGGMEKAVRQAQSKQKIIDKMVEAGLTEKPVPDPVYSFRFPECDRLPPPVCSFNDVTFAYSGKVKDILYKHISFGIDLDSRVALVGPNGAGKTTLLKLMEGKLEPNLGTISRHAHLRWGRFNQHSTDQLDLTKTPLQFMRDKFADGLATVEGKKVLDIEEWRSKLGQFGITGQWQTQPMETMSHGFQARVAFCLVALSNPHVLLLDEPTNHLDMSCIDSLAKAINNYNGGLVLVSHDFRLISQVAKEIWVVDHGVKRWDGSIEDYKKSLTKQVLRTGHRKKAPQVAKTVVANRK